MPKNASLFGFNFNFIFENINCCVRSELTERGGHRSNYETPRTDGYWCDAVETIHIIEHWMWRFLFAMPMCAVHRARRAPRCCVCVCVRALWMSRWSRCFCWIPFASFAIMYDRYRGRWSWWRLVSWHGIRGFPARRECWHVIDHREYIALVGANGGTGRWWNWLKMAQRYKKRTMAEGRTNQDLWNRNAELRVCGMCSTSMMTINQPAIYHMNMNFKGIAKIETSKRIFKWNTYKQIINWQLTVSEWSWNTCWIQRRHQNMLVMRRRSPEQWGMANCISNSRLSFFWQHE